MILGRNKVAQLPAECGELRDAVGADSIHSEGVQSFPLLGLVRGPRDDPRTNRVRPLDDLFVNRIDFLPEVFRGRSDKRSGRINVTRDLENARSHCRKDRFHDPDDAVIERMNRAACFGFAKTTRHQRLDVLRLDLHVDSGPVANGIEGFRKRWNARSVSERELLELRCRELSDGLVRRPLRMPGVDYRIVVNHDNPVMGRVHIQLNSIGSELDGALEGSERVLGMGLVRAPVSDALRRVQAATCSQAFLQVVAL